MSENQAFSVWLKAIAILFAAVTVMEGMACGQRVTNPQSMYRLSMSGSTSAVQGTSAQFSLVVRNPTDENLHLPVAGQGSYPFDIVVYAADGALVWRRHSGTFAEPYVARKIPPHESVTFTATWNLRNAAGAVVEPGTYRVEGVLVEADGTRVAVDSPMLLTVLPP